MKKILITGASGFIGSFLVEEAVSKGWQTWAGIRKSSSKEYLQDDRIQFIDLNFSDKNKLKEQIAAHVSQYGKWDYVIHNAGLTKCLNPADFDRVNYLFSKHLIEALQETGNVPEKFVLMSSLSAHHSGARTVYGASKLKAEDFLKAQTGFPFIILCPTGVYGPREKDYYLMLKTIKAGLDVTAGLKPQQLSFIYVKDLVQAAFLALESPVRNQSYFVADGNVYSDAEYTAIAKKALGKKWVLKIRVPLLILKTVSVFSEEIAKLTKKPSTLNRDKYEIMKQRDWSCNIWELVRDLHFQAGYDLERGMQECVDWYRANGWL
jgi:nucleoside-diphosphate-sugar epimerase